MKQKEAVHTRDRREDRGVRQEKLGSASETLRSKGLVDRTARRNKGSTSSHRAGQRRGLAPATTPGDSRVGVTFKIEAPVANQVSVAGTFNGWNPSATPLFRDSSGMWMLQMSLSPGTHEYRFIVDGAWLEDPRAARSVPNPFGERNSVVVVV